MFWSKKVIQPSEEYKDLYDQYFRQQIRDDKNIHRMVQLAYSLTSLGYDMPIEAMHMFIGGYNFYFKRVDGSVFSVEEVLEGKANICEADLIETEKWLRE